MLYKYRGSLHTRMRTHTPPDEQNQSSGTAELRARATYPRGVSELDAALPLLHPPDEDLEVEELTIFLEGRGETQPRPRPTNPVYDRTRLTPPYAVVCDAFPRKPTWCPTLPPATYAPRSWARPHLSPPLSRTRGARHRRQTLWQERPGSPMLLLAVATRGDMDQVVEDTPTRLYGAEPVPRPPLPAPEAHDRVHTFLLTQEVTAVSGVTRCGSPRQLLITPADPER